MPRIAKAPERSVRARKKPWPEATFASSTSAPAIGWSVSESITLPDRRALSAVRAGDAVARRRIIQIQTAHAGLRLIGFLLGGRRRNRLGKSHDGEAVELGGLLVALDDPDALCFP